ncbi:DUF4388 domain-containing protein, partial [bacterium]|nr:DUF4388 domain-containing protein [candidate division CSSED10-310 bacterium]
AIPDAFPERGSTVSRSLPMLMGTLFLRGSSGTLRLVEGKTLRSFYFEGGFLLGAKSSRKSEFLISTFFRSGALSKTVRQKLGAYSAISSDRELSKLLIKVTGIHQDRIDALNVRHIEKIVMKSLKMEKADYDWQESSESEGMLLLNATSLYPAHVLISSLRKLFLKPNYRKFLPKLTQWIIPIPVESSLQEHFRLAGSEDALLTLLAKGKTLMDLISEGTQVSKLATPLLHILFCFNGLTAGEKRPLSKRESESVLPRTIPSTIADFESIDLGGEESDILIEEDTLESEEESETVDSDQDEPAPKYFEMKKPQKEALPREPSKIQDKKPSMKPVQTRKSSGSIPGADQKPIKSPPKSMPPESAPSPQPVKPVVHKEKSVASRKVRELYPATAFESLELPEASGVKAFGLHTTQLSAGQLSEVHFPFLYALIMELKKTGTLSVHFDQYETKLFWSRGKLLFARSDNPKLRIDQIMIDMGMITPEQKSKVEEMISEMGKMRSGTLIFQKQIVNMMQLSEAIHQQVRLILNVLFNIKDGTYSFVEGELSEEEHIPLDLPAASLLIQELQKIKETNRLMEYLPSMTDILVQTKHAAEYLNQLKLGSTVASIFDKFRKPTSLQEALSGAEVSPRAFKIYLIGLMLLGLINCYSSGQE